MNPVRAVVFDTDGVLLDSAVLHASAWKTAFDGCLDAWAAGATELRPFDADREYRELVDGKPRYDGALAFLSARGIGLPPGARGNAPGCGTVWAVAARKEQIFCETLTSRAVEAFADVSPALGELKARGARCAAVSASRHARALLESADLVGLFDALVDGEDAARLGLAGKPAPALFSKRLRNWVLSPRTRRSWRMRSPESGREGGAVSAWSSASTGRPTRTWPTPCAREGRTLCCPTSARCPP
ncbi:HAD family hydrolase [Streptomyces sp. NPDC005356]|uniref:HAD family hydrolase n=1 Tax=Streptomyces sp. NPDC005356 TaxID=3157167 RepID=UPI0033B2BB3B